MSEIKQSQRIDKWLWHARFAKTRSLAQKLVTSGKVRLDRSKIVSASQPVRPGQVLTLTLPRQVKVLEILDLAPRRGPYSEAQKLYNDLTPKPQSQTAVSPTPNKLAEAEKQKRPNSRDRRLAIKLKQGSTEL